MAERNIQNDIRNGIIGLANMFRANIGQAWTGEATKLANGDILLRNPRPFSTGLPKGFSDLFGWVKHEITEEDVGKTAAIFTAVEVKDTKGRVSPEQQNFIKAVNSAGGRAGIARSVGDAIKILNKNESI